MYIWKKAFYLVIFFTSALIGHAQIDSTQHIIDGRRNSGDQTKKPYLILICGDGFRYDYAEKYHATNLLRFSAEGIRAESMIPSYPSVTHPNHFAIVSGLYPSHSGIVGNNFYDPALKKYFKGSESVWFGEEPIWITAEKQHMLTASFFWIDASTPMRGMLPTYYYQVNEKKNVLIDERIRTLKNWLSLPEDQRPHFLAFYFPDTDHQGHEFGPDAPETAAAVRYIDSAVGQINDAAQASGLPVNFIFVSDHGMTKVDQTHPAVIPKTAFADTQFVVNYQTAVANLYAKDPSYIQPAYEQLKAGADAGSYDVYLAADVPEELHYGAKDDKYHRIGDIIVIAKWPKTFNPHSSIGIHGFNPYLVKDVRASFYAWGPAFKQHKHIAPFQNVEVYDVMTTILGIQGLPNDGKGVLAKEILK